MNTNIKRTTNDEMENHNMITERHMKVTHNYPLHAYFSLDGVESLVFAGYVLHNGDRYPKLKALVEAELEKANDIDNYTFELNNIVDFVTNLDETEIPWEELEQASQNYMRLVNTIADEARYLHVQTFTAEEKRYLYE